MNVQQASQILGLDFPVTPDQLKSQYRKLALELHPDRTGGDDPPFKALSEAYHYITKHASDLVQTGVGDRTLTHTVDGTPLCELGLGLGPTTNGRRCGECRGAGHVPTNSWTHVPCTHKHCQEGWVYLGDIFPKGNYGYARRRCFWCFGGRKTLSKVGPQRLFCTACRGTGEIKIYNPVLPKGARAALAGKFNAK